MLAPATAPAPPPPPPQPPPEPTIATTAAVCHEDGEDMQCFCSEPNTVKASANASRRLRQHIILHIELMAKGYSGFAQYPKGSKS